MDNKSFGQNRMGICREGSKGQSELTVVLKKKKKKKKIGIQINSDFFPITALSD